MNLVNYSDVEEALKQTHVKYSNSLQFALDNLQKCKQMQFYRCNLPKNLISPVQNKGGHPAKTELLKAGGNVKEASENFLNNPLNYESCKCKDTIYMYKKTIESKKSLPPVFLKKECDKIFHIDGFHRMIAFYLYSKESKTIDSFVCT